MAQSMIIGISGGTGSGKTTVAQKIIASIGESSAVYLQQDSYYRNLGDMPLDQRQRVNFDHPDAFDGELMLRHLEALRAGKSIDRPIYNFVAHSRKKETIRVDPLPVVIVEGILVFFDAAMRSLMDLKIFVDTDADIRLIRRLERDIHARGRSAESVIEQYLATVRPMHLQFVAPAMRYADIILPEGGFNEVAIDLITGKIRSVLAAADLFCLPDSSLP
jgi:uridine kinase